MKKIIQTEKAPAPIGAYNQAVMYGNMIFTSGQIALDAKTGELITHNIKQEARKVMENVKVVLQEAGFEFSDVIKASIFLSNMQDFQAVNEVYSEYFDEATAPARECVQVAALPKYVNVEISMVAAK